MIITDSNVIIEQALLIEGMRQKIADLESTLKRAQKAIDAKDYSNGNLRAELRKAHQELQQLQDETGLEMDGMEEVIAYQDAQLPQMYDTIMRLRSQLNAAYERNLKQGFASEAAQEAAQQEIATLKRISEGYRFEFARLRNELENAEKDRDRLREWARDEIRKFPPYVQRVEAAEKEAADARRSNNCLLDQLQTAEAKLEWIRQNQTHAYDFMKHVMSGQSAPTPPTVTIDWTTAPSWANYQAFDKDKQGWYYKYEPKKDYDFKHWRQSDKGGELWKNDYTLPDGADWEQSLTQRPTPLQGETVPPRPMWSRYRPLA